MDYRRDDETDERSARIEASVRRLRVSKSLILRCSYFCRSPNTGIDLADPDLGGEYFRVVRPGFLIAIILMIPLALGDRLHARAGHVE